VLHRDKLRRLTPDNEATRRVQNLVEERRKLVEEKTAQLNRLTGYLKVYFPQMLEWFTKLDTKLVCDFLERWPSLEEMQKVPSAELKKFFRHRRGRHGELTEWRMQGIGQAMPAIRDRAVIEATSYFVPTLANIIDSLFNDVQVSWIGIHPDRRPVRFSAVGIYIQGRNISSVHCAEKGSKIVREPHPKSVLVF
jgi:hypothetical protein